MNKVTIDDKEYNLETKQKTNSVCGSRMNAQAAVLQTARMAYSEEALPKVQYVHINPK